MKAWILPLSNSCAVPDLRFGLSWRSIPAERVLEFSFREDAFLLTEDKDFGELVFREKRPHHGVVLLRMGNQSSANAISALERLFQQGHPLTDQFVVVTEKKVRVVNP